MAYSSNTPTAKIKHRTTNILTNRTNCDSPHKFTSTPPSKLTRIFNPFESHLIDRLHLPTFSTSPSVFSPRHASNPEKEFKWTIEDISNLKPADIDVTSVQPAAHHDSHLESLVQEKIAKFFNDKVVPSPMVPVRAGPKVAAEAFGAPTSDGSAQTVLTLPPRLPAQLEALLAPFCTFHAEQQARAGDDSALYRRLFEEESFRAESTECSPEMAPQLDIQILQTPRALERAFECDLSPIGPSRGGSRSACRLSFSGHMSVDAPEGLSCAQMEQSVDLEGASSSSSESVGSNTPHGRILASQRKRLSESFKEEGGVSEGSFMKRWRSQDHGYHTAGNFSETGMDETSFFVSTPTKH